MPVKMSSSSVYVINVLSPVYCRQSQTPLSLQDLLMTVDAESAHKELYISQNWHTKIVEFFCTYEDESPPVPAQQRRVRTSNTSNGRKKEMRRGGKLSNKSRLINLNLPTKKTALRSSTSSTSHSPAQLRTSTLKEPKIFGVPKSRLQPFLREISTLMSREVGPILRCKT